MRIKNFLLTNILTFVIIPVFFLMGIFAVSNIKSTNRLFDEGLSIAVNGQRSVIDKIFYSNKVRMETIGDFYATLDTQEEKERNKRDLEKLLDAQVNGEEYLLGTTVFDAEFQVIASSAAAVDEIAEGLIDGGLVFTDNMAYSDVIVNENRQGNPKVIMCIYQIEEKDEIIGYIAKEYDLDYFRQMSNSEVLWKKSAFYLLDGNQRIISAYTNGEEMDRINSNYEAGKTYSINLDAIDFDKKPEGEFSFTYNKETFVTRYSLIPNTNWVILVNVNKNQHLNLGNYLLAMVIFTAVICIVIAFGYSSLFKREITNPIDELNKKLQSFWQNQDYSVRIDKVGKDKIGEVATEVNALLDYIEEQHKLGVKKQQHFKDRAEIDSLSGLFNKATTTEKIAHILDEANENADIQDNSYAFLLIDIDNFKMANDTYGHRYGDAILQQFSAKLKEVFRGNDIIGRIGGDEFLVMMNQCDSQKVITDKAKEIGKFLNHSIHNNGEDILISVSIGISMYPDNGTTFDQLYEFADVAMYKAKQNGKNGFYFYQSGLDSTYVGERTQLENSERPLKVGSNVDFVFNILYETTLNLDAIQSVMTLVAKKYNFHRCYIYQKNYKEEYVNRRYLWENRDVVLWNHTINEMSQEVKEYIRNSLNENDQFIYDTNHSSEIDLLREESGEKNVCATYQFAIKNGEEHLGQMGYDYCTDDRILTEKELQELTYITRVLSTFYTNLTLLHKQEKTTDLLNLILDNIDGLAYVIDKNTYEILFCNHYATFGDKESNLGGKCFENYCKLDSPCKDCPVHDLTDTGIVTKIMNNKVFNTNYRVSATNIYWDDHREACLLTCINMDND